MDGRSSGVLQRGCLCCHCLLIESEQGLTLVDTGFGLRDVRHPSGRLSWFFLRLLSPDFREEMTAIRQIERLGFKPTDVRNIVLTHLDFDHAGGLDDFPHAKVHLMRRERDEAMAQRTWLDRQRFRPQQWSGTRHHWTVHEPDAGERWFDFEGVRQSPGLPQDVLLIPLAGHTMGHAGIAVASEGRWLLLAGDAYFHHQEMNVQAPWCTPGLRLYQTLMEKDRSARLTSQDRLRALKQRHGDMVDIFSSHDTLEFERLQARNAMGPATGEYCQGDA